MTVVKPAPLIARWGKPIAIVEADEEDMDQWVELLRRTGCDDVAWAYRLHEDRKIPHVLHLGGADARRKAISRIEYYANQLERGYVCLVGCDNPENGMRPPLLLRTFSGP